MRFDQSGKLQENQTNNYIYKPTLTEASTIAKNSSKIFLDIELKDEKIEMELNASISLRRPKRIRVNKGTLIFNSSYTLTTGVSLTLNENNFLFRSFNSINPIFDITNGRNISFESCTFQAFTNRIFNNLLIRIT